MLRLLAVIAFVIGVILFAVFALNSLHPASELGWGLVAVAAGLACFALEGVALPGPRPPA